MITNRRDLKFYLHEDAKSNGVKTGWKYYAHLIAGSENYHIYRYIKCLRYYEYHLNTHHKLCCMFYKVLLGRLGLKYNIRIMPNVCGYGLRIVHISGGGGVLLNAQSIGNYCSFNSGVLLGNKETAEDRPIIGNNVIFAPGSKGFGKVVIGDNVFVAINAVVTKDVPSNCVVAGIPAKVIKQNS